MSARRPYSIRRRILAGALALLAAITAVIAVLAHRFAHRAADEAFDRVLGAAALSIADAVQVEEGAVTVDVPYAAMAILSTTRLTRVFYRVTGPNGAVLTGHHDLGAERPPAPGPDPVFETGAYRGDPVRLARAGRYVATPDLAGYATITVAETLEAREALATEILRNAMAVAMGLAAIAIVLVWAGLRRAFAPFKALEAELTARTPTDLSPIRTELPREIAPLIGALNGFIGRLSTTLERLRGLAADAAHQIRTPLASMRAQSELALTEADPEAARARVGRVHANAVAATQIVNQILADATLAHRLETQARTAVDLLDLLEDLRHRLDERDAARLVVDTSGLAPGAEPLVAGDPFALREMVQNLVENALAYAPGPVEVSLAAEGASLRLAVADRGPGIPDAEKALVLERFRRGSGAAGIPGSGLGLSIVEAAARASGGRIDLSDRPGGGLVAAVTWEASAARDRGAQAAVLALGVGLAILALGPGPAAARVETWPAPAGQGGPVLRLVTDGEVATLRRLVRLFQLAHPGAGVEIAHLSAGLVEQAVRTARASGEGPDVAMSAAVDRQVRLVNDGLALPHRSAQTARLPDWATWRGELFGATYEPVVFAYDPRAFPGEEPPRTRLRLAQLLETEPERFRGRVITYHVGLNGMGYVFATFDSLTTPVFWRLARAMGDVEVRLASEPVEIMSALERGEASLAYNVAASASVVEGAIARGLILVEPQDYRLVVLRTLLVPRTAREPGLARAFIDLALSEAGQAAIGSTALLGPRRAAAEGEARAPAHVVPLAPASLIFLDERKRNRFLDTWLQLMVKP